MDVNDWRREGEKGSGGLKHDGSTGYNTWYYTLHAESDDSDL